MTELVAPFVWPLLLLTLAADLLLQDTGRPIAAWLGGDWLSRQKALAPLARNAALLVVSLAFLVKVPQLLTGSDRGTKTRRVMVLLSLIAVGAATLQATDGGRHWLTVQDVILSAALMVTAVAIARCDHSLRRRVLTAVFLAALTLPLFWRSAIHLTDTMPAWLDSLRAFADVAVLLAAAALVFSDALKRSNATIIATIIGVAMAYFLIEHGYAARELMRSATGLWFTTLPPIAIALAVGAMALAMVRIVLELGVRDGHYLWRTGILLTVLTRFLPERPEQTLGAFLAAIPLVLWSTEAKHRR